MRTSRRQFMLGATSGICIALTPLPLSASDRTLQDALGARFGEADINTGRVMLEIPALAENGNSVALRVAAESAMTKDDYVSAIHVFAPANPLPEVASFYFTPDCGRAEVSTRIRLSDSQVITAVAEFNDGTLWSATAKTVVTLAACIEPLL